MKTKVFFIYMALCAIMISLLSCEPTSLSKKNVLINLAELGEDIDGKSMEEIEKVISKKGFTRCYEWSYEEEGYFNGMYVYSCGIQLDSTWFGEDVTSKISLQEDNACVLLVDYFKKKDQTWVELAACYILPNNPTKDYKTLSENLYRYCSTNYSFKVSTENPEELARGYMWSADIDIDSTLLWYSNAAEQYQFALQAGLMTQEEYNEEMADYRYKFRKDFVEQLNHSYLAVYEEIEAADLTQNKYMCTGLLMSDDSDSFFEANGIMMAECYWVGHLPELPVPTMSQKQSPSKAKKAHHKFQWRNGVGGFSKM